MSSLSGLPPIDQSQLPADVRDTTPARKQAYEAGLGFEQMLVQQLSQSLVDSTDDPSSDDSTDGTDATDGTGGLGAGSPYASLLPDALTSGVMDAGGLGLARQLMDAMVTSPAGDPLAVTGGRNLAPTTTTPVADPTTTPTAPSAPSTGSASGGASAPA